MKVRRTWIACVLVWLPPSLAATAAEPKLPEFVGRSVCTQCHWEGGAAARCTIPPVPHHAGAFDALTMAGAEAIAALSGVADLPHRSRICLGCHAAAADEGPRWTQATFRVEDGVQCEACHGAGSLHVDKARAALGSQVPVELGGLRPGGAVNCGECHVQLPSHDEVLKGGFSLAPADRMFKTPVNVVVSRDGRRLYVVCEHANSLMVVDTSEGRVIGERSVGLRPHGAALSADGSRIFVTNRMSGDLTVIDAIGLGVTGTIEAGSEPHGIVVDPGTGRLLVMNTGDDGVLVFEPADPGGRKRLVAGRGPWAGAIDPSRGRAYVTSVRPNPAGFREPPQSEITVIDLKRSSVVMRMMVDQASMLQGIDVDPRTGLVLFTLARTKNLVPTTRVAQGWVITNGLGVLRPDGAGGGCVDQVLLDEPALAFADPADVAIRPDGREAVVVGSGANEVAFVDTEKLLELIDGLSDEERADVLPNHLGFSERFVIARVAVGANPRGVAWSPDGKWVYVANALDDSISVIDVGNHRVVRTIELDGPKEATQIRRGERLFHDASVTFGRQFSCRSCHPDGHLDGLTFDIEADGIGMNPMDNRTLRGILDTAPFKWEGTNPSLHRQCGPRFAVFFTRLRPFPPDDLDALVRYMCTIERPPNRFRRPDGLTDAQRRGKEIFERTALNDGTPIEPEQRCSHCHSGPYRTNRQKGDVGSTMWFDVPVAVEPALMHDVAEFGELGSYYFIDTGVATEAFDTPHLTNIQDSAPFLHNGAARTLEEIWTRFNIVNRHGATADLTREQFNDLISYLKSQ